jgi:spermidine/putrescine-binding protein
MSGVDRRTVLKGISGILATGMAPAIHAAEPITLRYLGTAVNQDKAIAERFKADTGIEIRYVAVTTDEVTQRAITSPQTFDLLDIECASLKKVVPTGNLKGIDVRRVKNFDKISPVMTVGAIDGKQIGEQGTAPKKVLFMPGEKSKTFASGPTQHMSVIPTVYNADTLGIRPDLIKRPISSWKEMLNPEFKGKTAILNIPSIGIMDAAMAVEAAGFGIPATLTGRKLDGAYEFINWFLDGWAGAYLNRQGYYSAVLDTAQAKMEAYEWAYWMEGKAAEKDIKAPNGQVLAKAGSVRDGGSYSERMGSVACWNAIMDENLYMVRRWNEFVAA